MEPKYKNLKQAWTKLLQAREILQSVPDDDDVRFTLEGCERALRSDSPAEIRRHAAECMFTSTAVDDKYGDQYERSLNDVFNTAMKLVPREVDYESRDEVMKKAGLVDRERVDLDGLADRLLDE